MTDPSGLTPEQDAVRRLLADARHDGPTPPDVVARLDETLASLVAERVSEPVSERESASRATSAPVVDLGARRRRTVGIGLLAAAAVVVAGVAIGQGLPPMSGSDSGDSSAGAGDSSVAESRDYAAEEGDASSDGGAERQGPESLKSTAPEAGVPTLSSTDDDLDDDLLDLRSSPQDGSERSGAAAVLSDCDLRGIGRGRRVVAQVDGQVGIVVFRRPDRAAQQADLYVCSSPAPVRTLTLPAP